MAPSCSRAAVRLLTTILLVSSVANAVALPHQVLDPRTPLSQENVELSQAVAAAKDSPQNFWEAIGKLLNDNTGWDIFRDFWARLFGGRDDNDDGNGENDSDDDDTTVTTTVYVTPTPAASSDVAVPPGPSASATEISPQESSVFSILPVGDLSTGIDLGVSVTVVFSTAEETPVPSATEGGVPPYSLNATTTYDEEEEPPTAVPITDEFSVTIPIELVTTSVPTDASPGTTEILPWINETTPTIWPSLVTDVVEPTGASNETALNTTSTTVELTSIIVVTATVTPVPVDGTGTVSVGTGLPVAVSESPVWSNSTSEPPFVTEVPIIVTGVPGSVFNVSVSIPLATFTNSTASIGTGVPSPVSEIPIYTNTSSAGDIAVTPVPLPGTGSAAPSAGTGLPIVISEVPIYTNTSSDEGASATALPLPGTGSAAASSGTGLPPVISEAPIYSNTTSDTQVAPTALPGTGSAEPSDATELPTPSESPLYTNKTTSARWPSKTEGSTIEFPGLLALRTICNDPQIRVVTLPLLDRFYGPNGYPSLYSFPGCSAPNARQAIQAPGLLDCSRLGEEVQRCQGRGKKVLLSVKADGVAAVGGNENFGRPPSRPRPFGPTFAAGGSQQEKRQILGPIVNNLLRTPTPVVLPPLVLPTAIIPPLPNINLTPLVPIFSNILNGVLGTPSTSRRSTVTTLVSSGTRSSVSSIASVAASSSASASPPISTSSVVLSSTPLTSSSVVEIVSIPIIDTSVEVVVGPPSIAAVSTDIADSTAVESPAATTFSDVEVFTSTISSEVIVASEVSSSAEPEVTSSAEVIDAPAESSIAAPVSESSSEVSSEAPAPSAVETVSQSVEIPAATPEPLPLNDTAPVSNTTDATEEPAGTPEPVLLNSTSPDAGSNSTEELTLIEPSVIETLYSLPQPTPVEVPFPFPIISDVEPEATPSAPIEEIPVAFNSTAPDNSTEVDPVIIVPEPTTSGLPIPVIPIVAPTPSATNPPFPNLFDKDHLPSALGLTLFSLFGEGHTERADLRPLGPDVPSGASPENLNGTDWINPVLTALQRPLGEEVIVDGFDIQVPAEWKGTYQGRQFQNLVRRLRDLNREAWQESGGKSGGPGDLGADGRSVVYFGYSGDSLKVRSENLEVVADMKHVGWKEWKPEGF